MTQGSAAREMCLLCLCCCRCCVRALHAQSFSAIMETDPSNAVASSIRWVWCRFKREFEERMDEQMRKERAEATLRARAAAWEAEKAEAQANRVCFAHTCRVHTFTGRCVTCSSL